MASTIYSFERVALRVAGAVYCHCVFYACRKQYGDQWFIWNDEFWSLGSRRCLYRIAKCVHASNLDFHSSKAL